MRFSAPKEELLHGVRAVSKALPGSSSEPMLLDILFEAVPGELRVFATDNRVSIRHTLKADVSEAGSVAVRGTLVNELLQSLSSVDAELVHFDSNERYRTTIASGSANYEISGDDPKGFPLVPPFSAGETLSIPAGELRNIVKQTTVVAGGGLTGQTFEEVFFGIEDGALVVVSTDSVRLTVRRWRIPESAKIPSIDIRVPIHALVDLGKILPNDGEVEILVGDDAVAFRFNGTEFRTRLSDRPFPNYKQILPKSSAMSATVNTKDFADALKGTLPLARETKQKVHLKFSEGELEVLCVSPDIGKAKRVFQAEVSGKHLELAFNARFLLDFLGAATSETVRFQASSSVHPACLVPVGDGDAYTYIVMPINL